MAVNILADFFNMINVPMMDTMSVVFIISFIVWELPRSVKLLSEEYTKGLYPENGRVVDFLLFIIGALAMLYLMAGSSAEKVVAFLKTPGITAFFLILMLSIPLIVVVGFFKRLFARVDAHNSIAVFLAHSFLDLMHTLFYVSLAVLAIPVAGMLIMGK